MPIIEYISYLLIPLLILTIICSSTVKKLSAYDAFIDGAKEGFTTILRIFPSMLAVVVAINIFKSSGAMQLFINTFSPIVSLIKVPPEVVPVGVMRSISGSGALAVLTDILKSNGPDSLIGKIASTIMGSSDTTLYVVAIYTATVGITKTKDAILIGLLCDLIAFLIAVWIWV